MTIGVTVTPEASYDPAVNLVASASCTAMVTCLAQVDDGIIGDAETVSYTNQGAAAEPVYIVVDSTFTDASGG